MFEDKKEKERLRRRTEEVEQEIYKVSSEIVMNADLGEDEEQMENEFPQHISLHRL